MAILAVVGATMLIISSIIVVTLVWYRNKLKEESVRVERLGKFFSGMAFLGLVLISIAAFQIEHLWIPLALFWVLASLYAVYKMNP